MPQAAQEIRISAVVATYNRDRYLPTVLESLKNQSLEPGKFEIIIIDNNCTDTTAEISNRFIRENPEIQSGYYLEKKQGLSFGRNAGIALAKGDFITFIDDDAYIQNNFLEILVNYFDAHPDVIAAGGKILLHYEKKRPSWATPILEQFFGFFDRGDKEKQFRKDYPKGSNMTFRSLAFQKFGSFDHRLGRIGNKLMGAEEKEMFQRIYKARGKVMYLPTAVVYHFVPEERTKKSFLKRQALGVGISEFHRTRSSSYPKRIIIECMKWVATVFLLIFFTLLLNPGKGIKLLFIRYYISKGLITGQGYT